MLFDPFIANCMYLIDR